MFKIAICDDDAWYRLDLVELIRESYTGNEEVDISEFCSGRMLLEQKIDEFDVIFLDIQMEEMDGNETAVRLKKKGYRGILVQCSGIYHPTPETIKISPYRYLLKQDSREKTMMELKEVWEELLSRKQCMELDASYVREKVKVKVSDITYITHHPKGSVLHLYAEKMKQFTEGNIIAPYSFEELLNLLEEIGFAIPHNSYIVNLRFVSGFDIKRETIVVDGKTMFMSRGKKDTFLSSLTEYSRKKYKEKL